MAGISASKEKPRLLPPARPHALQTPLATQTEVNRSIFQCPPMMHYMLLNIFSRQADRALCRDKHLPQLYTKLGQNSQQSTPNTIYKILSTIVQNSNQISLKSASFSCNLCATRLKGTILENPYRAVRLIRS